MNKKNKPKRSVLSARIEKQQKQHQKQVTLLQNTIDQLRQKIVVLEDVRDNLSKKASERLTKIGKLEELLKKRDTELATKTDKLKELENLAAKATA